MRKFIKIVVSIITTGIIFITCSKPDRVPDFPNIYVPKVPPKAIVAGNDTIIRVPSDSIFLTGSGIDTDGSIVSYSWRIAAFSLGHAFVPSGIIIINPNNATTLVKNLPEGIYDFELTVTDNDGLSAKDGIRVLFTRTNTNCICYPYECDTVADPCDPWDY